MTLQQEYEATKASGMMWVWFPEFTGVWAKDRAAFFRFRQQNPVASQMVGIWDKVEDDWMWGDDGPRLFLDTTAARNWMFTKGYSLGFVGSSVEFKPYSLEP